MTIVGTAAVPRNGNNLRNTGTFELPTVRKPDDAPKSDPVQAEVLELAARISQKIADGKIGREQVQYALLIAEATQPAAGSRQKKPPLPCPPFCVEHTNYAQSANDRNVWAHQTTRTTVTATYVDDDGPTSSSEVEVWAERFDTETRPGRPTVLLGVAGTDALGMTPDQAEQIAEALLAGATAARQANGTDEWAGAHDYAADEVQVSNLDEEGKEQAAKILRLLPREVVEEVAPELVELWAAGYMRGAVKVAHLMEPKKPQSEPAGKHAGGGPGLSPVWPPKVCPPWCEYADDPERGHSFRGGPDLLDSRVHVHSCYSRTPGAEPGVLPEPGTVDLTLEEPIVYPDGNGLVSEHQHMSVLLTQHYRSVEPEITLSHNAGPGKSSSQVDMTPGEARALGELLIHMADLADQNTTDRSPRAA